MSIPLHSFSTTLQQSDWLYPDNLTRPTPTTDYEAGPIALNDPSSGLDYQNWILTWDSPTGNFTVTPVTIGSPSIIINASSVTEASFCFDQNAHVNIAYVASGQAYLYWYDSNVADWVTTVLDASVVSTMLSLDDKRTTQTNSSDMILWYTRDMGDSTYDLFTREQRDRFETEYLMAEDIPAFVKKAGMNTVLRGQVALRYTLT